MINALLAEMEMKRLHMGTMSFGADTMDEVTHQLATAFGASADQGRYSSSDW
jgi:phospholipid-translocating ATPase